jgi:hypothetical protein
VDIAFFRTLIGWREQERESRQAQPHDVGSEVRRGSPVYRNPPPAGVEFQLPHAARAAHLFAVLLSRFERPDEIRHPASWDAHSEYARQGGHRVLIGQSFEDNGVVDFNLLELGQFAPEGQRLQRLIYEVVRRVLLTLLGHDAGECIWFGAIVSATS